MSVMWSNSILLSLLPVESKQTDEFNKESEKWRREGDFDVDFTKVIVLMYVYVVHDSHEYEDKN